MQAFWCVTPAAMASPWLTGLARRILDPRAASQLARSARSLALAGGAIERSPAGERAVGGEQ